MPGAAHDLPVTMIGVAIEEVTEQAAAVLLAEDRTPAGRPNTRIALAIAAHLESVGGRRPAFGFEMITRTEGLVYVTDDGWPGSGIYRVTVTP